MEKYRLTETEKYIWQFINQNFDIISKLTIAELANKANVSTTSIVRTLKKQGYNGFSDFKYEIKSQKANQLTVLKTPHITNEIKQSILKNYQEVIRTLNMIDVTNLESALLKIKETKKIVIFARGLSELIASEMLVKFQLIHKYCEVYSDPNIIRPVSRTLTKDNLAIFISLNGETKALVDAATNCQNQNVPMLLITAKKESMLTQLINLQLIGFRTDLSYFPEFEVHSRLSLSIISRILLDCYVAKFQNHTP